MMKPAGRLSMKGDFMMEPAVQTSIANYLTPRMFNLVPTCRPTKPPGDDSLGYVLLRTFYAVPHMSCC